MIGTAAYEWPIQEWQRAPIPEHPKHAAVVGRRRRRQWGRALRSCGFDMTRCRACPRCRAKAQKLMMQEKPAVLADLNTRLRLRVRFNDTAEY